MMFLQGASSLSPDYRLSAHIPDCYFVYCFPQVPMVFPETPDLPLGWDSRHPESKNSECSRIGTLGQTWVFLSYEDVDVDDEFRL